jgi:small subunit ribosomal protein S4
MAILYRQHKKYSRPRKMFDSERIKEENSLVKKYGLKNKREIWKADAIVKRLRELAKKHITASNEEQEKFISRLTEKGFLKKNSRIDDVLDMKIENILDRRLQTIVMKKGFAKTIKEARQAIVHKRVLLNNHVVNIPSYNVNLKEESSVELKKHGKKETKENKKIEEVSE